MCEPKPNKVLIRYVPEKDYIGYICNCLVEDQHKCVYFTRSEYDGSLQCRYCTGVYCTSKVAQANAIYRFINKFLGPLKENKE